MSERDDAVRDLYPAIREWCRRQPRIIGLIETIDEHGRWTVDSAYETPAQVERRLAEEAARVEAIERAADDDNPTT